MIEFFSHIFGNGSDLNSLQMAGRAIVTFIIALLLVRISGRRSFGLQVTFDNVIVILLGSILSRVVVGASPFIPTVFACLIMALLHRLFSILTIQYNFIEKLTKGEKILLFKDGKFINTSLIRGLVSIEDIMEEVRLVDQHDSTDKVKAIYLERNGKISVLKKDDTE